MADYVLGHGPANARILIVGEAPAVNELREGIPFVGRAGQELDKMLNASGLMRSQVYVTNTSVRPIKGDKVEHFMKGGQPTAAFLEGLALLQDNIRTIKPNVVVAMGNWALMALMGHQDIMKWRGSILWSDIFGVKVVPTIHPAALLRGKQDDSSDKATGGMWKMRTVVVWDLMRAKAESAFPELRRRPRNILVDPKGEALDGAVHRLLTGPEVVFDLESFGGLNLACIGFSDGDPEWATVIPYDGTATRLGLFREILESDKPKVTQNGCTYDVPYMDQHGIHTKNHRHDTMLGAHTLNVQLPKKLEFLTSIYTDMPYYKFEGQVWKHQPTGRDLDMFYNYCGKDVCATTEIKQNQVPELQERRLMPIFNQVMEICEPFRWATFKGIRVDLKELWQNINESVAKLNAANEDLKQISGKDNLNPNSPKQMVKLLYEDRKLPPRRKKGKLTTGAKQIIDLAAKTGDPAPMAIVRARRAAKALSTIYNVKILSSDGRTRSVYNPGGTISGRPSSPEPLFMPGINGLNLPRRRGSKAKRMLLADDGFEFLECDQVQAEAIITAYLANDPIHMDCFRTGKDVHRVTACLLVDRPTSEWQQIPKDSILRDLAKVGNHELNYGAGPVMFMYTVNEEWDPDDPNSLKLDEATARGTYVKYHQVRPALQAYWKSIQVELRQNNMTLRNVFGREVQFLDHWSDELLRSAYSWKPQSTVGDATNIGILQMYDSEDPDIRYLFRQGLRLANQVYDSSGWMLPLGAREYVPKILSTLEVPIFVNGYNITVPIEGAVGPSLYKPDMTSMGQSRKYAEEGYA